MPVVPLDVLSALGELNRAVRVQGWGRAPKCPVYAYKQHVLETLADAGALICRPILVSVECRNCGGVGRWTDWSGCDHGPCRRCSAKGRIHLRFVLSTLPDGQQWHTPHLAGHELLRRAWGPMTWEDGLVCYVATLPDGVLKPVVYEPVFDWKPGGTVEDGPTPDRLADLLNQVEDRMPAKLGWQQSLDRIMFSYKLDIGRRLGVACWHCGEPCPDEQIGHGIGSARHEWLSWSMRVHSTCRPAETLWPRVPPEEALTPNVRQWLNRRAGRARVRRDDW